ncbi:MAG: M20/M25/M40 family metallo-hydrolase [Chloroflexi bacterium]|nr:M20/M25/M40 family metallo-hydrolase [Chloroflexota bacterium]MCL5273786.1 M20/M25/M40 family metallo-hydrolase [Chloroflexota bacterium]
MQLHEQIREWIQRERQTMLDSLRYIVAINTENLAPGGNETEGQLAVAAMLRMLGCEVDVYDVSSAPGLAQHPRYWPARPCTGRPNVMAIRRGLGKGRSLLFSSHMDTVPVGPDIWQHDPWGGEIADGRLYGLGAYDMKGGLVASIMAVKALNDLGIRLQGDLLVESVVDEEYGGCNGTIAGRLKYNADLAIVPEPTNMAVCPAHHGGLMLRVTFVGKPGWGFSPDRPIDPVIAVARFISMLNDYALHRQQASSVPGIYQDNPTLPILVNQVKAGDVTLPFFGDRVPAQAWLTVWLETYPGMAEDAVLRDIQAYYRQAQANDPVLAAFEPVWQPVRWLDGSHIADGHPGIELLIRLTTDVCRRPATVQGALFACDGHIFNLFSPTPMILLGPSGGQPHSPDEYIKIKDYLQLVEIFIHAAIEWCGLA